MEHQMQTLGGRCLAHLRQEEAVLQLVHELVQEMRQALLDRDAERMSLLIDRQRGTTRRTERIAAERDLLRQEIANHVGVSRADATVSLLAEHCAGPLRESLHAQRERLKGSARRVNTLVNANATLTSQLLEWIEVVFQTLSGDPARVVCYERTGRTTLG